MRVKGETYMCRKSICKTSGWLESFSTATVLAALIAVPSLHAAPIPAGCLNGGMASVITVSPTTAHLVELGAIALIRTFLNYFLNKELKEEKESLISAIEKKE